MHTLHISVMTGETMAPGMNGFHSFFEFWLSEQNQHLDDLVVASRRNQSKCDDDDQVVLSSLLERVLKHYEQYYNVKSQWASQDVLQMLSPPWRTPLEDAFLWIGGWRPSMAFHLLYAKSGLQLEAGFAELMQGLRMSPGDLGDLSQGQLTMVDKLQRRTIQEENNISEKMAKQQESVADNTLVQLSHLATEMMREDTVHEEGVDDHMEKVESALASKEEGLEMILHKADNLRLRTLKNITQILSPLQAVHFLIAAAELHLRLHDWGKKKDDASN